ncbi:hypothetical protein BJK06_15255 [Curtobacterium sp. BH-2-1-1]|uniref:hypothetical protein n=1 Tax=Curtobacterium sp. BH-2-1-1 TaxID=1905847 RepID=UPI00089E07FF|nr:hypothetical protein [Curtobacterium sp. BH-2-1-1]AOX66901.1 hypothetical protein BJK06_15255 [Curtobacterium sp. BH-2-1-1]
MNATTPSRRRAAIVTAVAVAVAAAGSTAVLGVDAASASTTVTSQHAAATPAPLAFTQSSSAAHPIALTATAGKAFAHTFTTNAKAGSVAYAMDEPAGLTPDSPRASDHFSVNTNTGVLSGTGVESGIWDFQVVALRNGVEAHAYVQLTVLPGAAVGVRTYVSQPNTTAPIWYIAPNGVIRQRLTPTSKATVVKTVPAVRLEQLIVTGVAVDAEGNVIKAPDEGGDVSTVTSNVTSDHVTRTGAQDTITISGAWSHRLTVTQEHAHTSFTVSVAHAAH